VVFWSRRFEKPIELPDGRKLKTLAEAINWLAKEIPKSEHKMEKVQTAAHCVTHAAERGGPMIFAQMGMMRAIHRHRERVFNPDRKDTHLGETQAEERPMKPPWADDLKVARITIAFAFMTRRRRWLHLPHFAPRRSTSTTDSRWGDF
jgi:hypothetical protein